MPVSRETDAPGPDTVAALFPQSGRSIYRYVDLLIHRGVERGLIGPREIPRIWKRHILNCAVIRDVFGEGVSVADVGSGAGLPGIVVALSRPDLRIALIEPLLRRTMFLTEAVNELELANVEVVRARAEDLVGERHFDVVTARAVAPLTRLIPWTLPLCRPGGELVALKGQNVEDELSAAKDAWERLGGHDARVEVRGAGIVTPPTTLVRIVSGGRTGRAPRSRRGGR